MVGGTMSALTGGKFANGAITSALQWWYNAEGNPDENIVQTKLKDGSKSISRIGDDGEVLATLNIAPGKSLADSALRDALLDLSAQEQGRVVKVTSGYRTQKEQNDICAENPSSVCAKRSSHTYDRAADIKIDGYSVRQVMDAAYLTGHFTRISMYTNPSQSGIVHVDNRGGAPFFGKNLSMR